MLVNKVDTYIYVILNVVKDLVFAYGTPGFFAELRMTKHIMQYSVKQLADLAGVSVRTLHYYDQISLLKPARTKNNGYRVYGENELLKLQQILFFRELDFPLDEIRKIISSPGFDMHKALSDQKNMLRIRMRRLNGLLKTIDKTLNKLNKQKHMEDKELYEEFDDAQMKEYAQEAKQRWGQTDAYKTSMERFRKMNKEDLAKIKEDGDKLMKEIAASMGEGPTSEKFQKLIAKHYDNLRIWYEPNLEMYRGLADMYVNDSRFAAYYEKYAPGLAKFMREAMHYFADSQEGKS